jgi:hypothetical protein
MRDPPHTGSHIRHPRDLQSSKSRKLIRDGTVPAYIFIINVRSSVAENITKQNPEKRGTIHIYSLADFRETKNTISIGEWLKLDPYGCFHPARNNHSKLLSTLRR